MFSSSKHSLNSPAHLMKLFVVCIFAIAASKASAQVHTTNNTIGAAAKSPAEAAILSDFYTFEDSHFPLTADSSDFTEDQTEIDTGELPDPSDMSPLNAVPVKKVITYARAVAKSLLRWTHHDQLETQPTMKYDRKFHFGRWINDPNDQTCYNTRARVLIRDSETSVSFKDKNHCVVDSGRWEDPYAGGTLYVSKELHIDHMVPLKNAYISGAWEWDFQTRCTYANYMGNPFHLITASGRENMSKGDDTPEKYMPPNSSYRCEYLANWLKIKLIWNLRMGRSEAEAINRAMEESNCDGRKFKMSIVELKRQRKLIYENRFSCPDL